MKIIENLQNTNWVRLIVVVIVALVVQYFMRKRTDKMEKRLFGDDADRYRADKDGVSPFDRPPVGFDAEKAKKDAAELEKAKKGSEGHRVVKELKREPKSESKIEPKKSESGTGPEHSEPKNGDKDR